MGRRNTRTRNADIDNDLPPTDGALSNPIHDRYAQFRAAGYSQIDSYRRAKPSIVDSTPKVIGTAAWRLESRPDVAARITQLRQQQITQSAALLSRRQLGEMIADELRHMAQDVGGLTAAAGLVDKYCKMFGLFEPDRVQVAASGAAETAVAESKIAALLRDI